MSAPMIVPNPRIDVVVADPDGQPRRQTTYEGVLRFGTAAVGIGVATGGAASRLHFQGPVFLPDGLVYLPTELGNLIVSTSVWLASGIGDRSFVHQATHQWLPDPRDPSQLWLGLVLDVQLTIGTVLGYRVTVLAPHAAVVPPPPG